MLSTKICTHCGIDKLAAEYTPRSRVKSGLASWCLACARADSRKKRAAIAAADQRWHAWQDRRAEARGAFRLPKQVMT